MLTRRYGKFEVSMALIEDNPKEVNRIFEGLVVTRAEHLFHKDTIEYIAWSPYFRECEVGEEIPEYMAMCSSQPDGSITVKWVDVARKAEKEINTRALPAERVQKTITVNGVEVKTASKSLTYDDIVRVAELPRRDDYTMTWSNPDNKDKGIMHLLSEVYISEGLIFNATLTGAA